MSKQLSRGVGKKTTGKTSKDIYAQPGDDWQAESDFNALARAHEIKSDKPRHARAMAHGRKKALPEAKEKHEHMAAVLQSGKSKD